MMLVWKNIWKLSFHPLIWLGSYCALLLWILALELALGKAALELCSTGLCRVETPDALGLPGSLPLFFTVFLLAKWLVFFGGRWLWLRWKVYDYARRIYDFPEDEHAALVRGWSKLAMRQLIWWMAGSLWCAFHLAAMLWLPDNWLLFFSLLDALGLILVIWLHASTSQQLQYSMLVGKHRIRLFMCGVCAWLLALVWLLLEHLLLASSSVCRMAFDCYSAYALAGQDILANWPIAASLLLLLLQLMVWLLVLLMQYRFAAHTGGEIQREAGRFLYPLQFAIPLVWLAGLLAMEYRVPVSIAVALAGILLLMLLLRVAFAAPVDSLGLRLAAHPDFRHWLISLDIHR